MIPPVMANDLEFLIGKHIVAGNLPLSHRKVRFEKLRPLCSAQQFVRWKVHLLILGEVCSREDSFTRSFFKVPIQRCSGYTEGIADIGNTGVLVFQKRRGHAEFSVIHFRRPGHHFYPVARAARSPAARG